MPFRFRMPAVKALFFLVLVSALGHRCTLTGEADPNPTEVTDPDTTDNAPVFKCEGKTHCSEMGSCAEAVYYLENCPDTQMDGDGDGIPCESQWCG